MRGNSRTVLIVAAILFIAAGQAGADVLFNTFGPGDSYQTAIGWTIGLPPGTPDNFAQGNQFSFTGLQSYRLDSIELAVGLVAGTNQVNVSLMNDAAGLPAAVLEAFSFTDQMGPFGSNNPPLVGTSVAHPLLAPGMNYWLIASASNDTWAAWNLSSLGGAGQLARSTNGGEWSTSENPFAAFRINGTLVPVPGAVLLGVLGLGFAGGLLRRRSA